MKRSLFGLLKKSTLPALVVGAALALASPASVLAAGHGGGGGHGGGFSGGGHAFSSGGRSFSGGARGFEGGGRAYGGAVRGGYYGGGYRGGYYGGGYYGAPLLGFGFSAGYPANSCGYYDQSGYWHANPACYSGGYGYGY
jgi:hypothetical protein